uniref:Uncharacterized protein n=1 Tax=Daphnia galeata TaxID=27404 RepID=A0A8J2RZR5_9CRUS|nr:unnamed protein product [Daphnia galeata]
MDRVKKYWQEIIKERDHFWSSFFLKYQEEKQDVDVQSYMNNSSSRISTLLKLAADEDDEETEVLKATNSKVLQYFEEQSGESSEANSAVEVATPLNKDQEPNNENFKPSELPVVLVKRVEPTFVWEIDPEEEDSKQMSLKNSHPAKKLKLFEFSPQIKGNVTDTINDYQCNNLSGNVDIELLSESTASTVSKEIDYSFQKLSCRRLKSMFQWGIN